jgi:hypothetical protein
MPQEATPEDVVAYLDHGLARLKNHPALWSLPQDLKLSAGEYRRYASEAAAAARLSDRAWADFAAAFACDGLLEQRSGGVVQDTAFRTMAGAGHQHFIGFMRKIVDATTPSHLMKTLFLEWTYDDPLANLSLRWDPNDEQRYAHRWGDPSRVPERRQRGSMLGANRLAIEALPLFPSVPVGRRLRTTGFSGRSARDIAFAWPIWSPPVSLNVVRSVLSLKELQQERLQREQLAHRGIVDVFRSRRRTEGQFRSFAPARSA